MLGEPRYSAGIRYDPSVLREMAARLEASADVTVVIWTVLGVVLGLVGGAVFGVAIRNPGLGAIAGAIGGGVVGYVIGEHRALEIRFTAQLALYQMAIEENTRSLSGPTRVVEPPAALSFGTAAADAEEGRHAVSGPAAFAVPAGDWFLDPKAAAAGRYEGLAADDSIWWARAAVGKTINLRRNDSGLWVDIGQGGRDLVDDRYQWATSHQHPRHVLVLDSQGAPVLLLRQV